MMAPTVSLSLPTSTASPSRSDRASASRSSIQAVPGSGSTFYFTLGQTT